MEDTGQNLDAKLGNVSETQLLREGDSIDKDRCSKVET